MAALARVFGVMCMVFGGLGVCLAVFNFTASADGATAADGGGYLLLLTVGMIAGSLFLGTVGAIAGVVADIAEARQPTAQPRPAERPYGVSHVA